MTVSVVLADDHQVIREGLQALLSQEKDLDVIGQAADGVETLRVVSARRPDILILDLAMPGLPGLEGRGTAEQWIKEGKYALNWTRLSCHRFVANQVRLWLFVLAYNLGNFMRKLTLPESVDHWSLRSVQTKLIKMGGRLVRHARRLVFQLAEVAVAREVFRQVLERIAGLHPAPG